MCLIPGPKLVFFLATSKKVTPTNYFRNKHLLQFCAKPVGRILGFWSLPSQMATLVVKRAQNSIYFLSLEFQASASILVGEF